MSVSQGTPRITGSLQKLGKRCGTNSPLELPKGTHPANPFSGLGASSWGGGGIHPLGGNQIVTTERTEKKQGKAELLTFGIVIISREIGCLREMEFSKVL